VVDHQKDNQCEINALKGSVEGEERSEKERLKGKSEKIEESHSETYQNCQSLRSEKVVN
jgi:hypothetical protein